MSYWTEAICDLIEQISWKITGKYGKQNTVGERKASKNAIY